MQGFVNLATDVGEVIAILIPLICYLGAGGILIASGWGLWQMNRPGSFYEKHPWVPFVGPLFAGMLLTFDRVLNEGSNTMGGGGAAASMAAAVTSYTPPTVDPTTLLGATPEATLLNIITTFIFFFRSYGALIVLLGFFKLKGVTDGNKRGHTGTSLIMITFGFAVMNADTISSDIMSHWHGTGT